MPGRPTVIERYESYVDRSLGLTACHPWIGSCDSNGYGLLKVDNKTVKLPRWAYLQIIGPLDSKEQVRHTCDNPPCQNPRHWLKGSAKDNMRDMTERGRAPDRRGVKNGRAVLKPEDVLAIRGSAEPPSILAERYGVTVNNIVMVQRRQSWKHLP